MCVLAELHCHTTFSDGFLTPEACASRARRRGLSILAITDHNTAEGGLLLQEEHAQEGFIVIPGEEISTDQGHLLAYFIKSSIAPGPFEDVMGQVEAQDGIAFMAHPYHIPLGNRWRRHPIFKLQEENIDRVVGLEVVNGHNRPAANNLALTLAAEYGIPGIAGSDAHFGFEIGNAVTTFDLPEISMKSVKNALRSGLFKPNPRRFNAYPIYLLTGLLNKAYGRRYAWDHN